MNQHTDSMLCEQEDEWLLERQDAYRTAIWVVDLCDGLTFYQDDGRPGINPPSAWSRLKTMIEESGSNWKNICNISLKFRSEQVGIFCAELHPAPDGFFFTKKAIATMGMGMSECYVFGFVDEDGSGHQVTYSVPELIKVDEGPRQFDIHDKRIIWLHGKRT